MQEYIKRPAAEKRDSARQSSPATFGGAIPNSAMAALLGIEEQKQGFINPALAARFQRSQIPYADRLSIGITSGTPDEGREAMGEKLGAETLVPGSGRALQVPDKLRSNLESHFGYSVDNLKFRESGDVDSLGAKAYAKGDEIHFAPGQFRPDTAQGVKMIAHEVSHIRQQARSGVADGGVELSPALEHAADTDGDAVAAMAAAPALQTDGGTAALSPMPAASFASAPAQGWGIDFLGRKNKGAHERLTEAARLKASRFLRERDGDAGNLSSDTAQKSLQYGARFNDVGHHSVLGMVGQMEVLKKDAFINQTHHGDMQFLHSMDTSQGDLKANMAKAQRYAQFASDVYQNRDGMQDMTMLEYLKSQNPGDGNGSQEGYDPLQEMFMSMMVSPKALKKFDKKFFKKKENKLDTENATDEARAHNAEIRARRTRELLRLIDGDGKKFKSKRSKYADMSIKDFYTNGDESLDAGLVALGSASHMMEDSFAGSHAIRAENLFLGRQGDSTSRGPDTELSDTGDAIADKATPVISSANYNDQDNFIIGGRHGKADSFNDAFDDPSLPEEEREENLFQDTRGASLARDAAAQYLAMNARMKRAGTESYESSGTKRFVQNILKADQTAASVKGGVTTTGAAFSKLGKGLFASRQEKAYREATEEQSHNIRFNPVQRLAASERQISALEGIVNKSKNPSKLREVLRHVNELSINVQSEIDQLNTAGAGMEQNPELHGKLELCMARLRALSRKLNGGRAGN